ncbi:MAG: hypothetical protein A3F17_03375 [Gammaproteobacteria bacterium RIFCSPHIGHO2_12_FULL_41_15]|nr:MAG: hypothetical protein A3F17_03375 [Gammaproteobacteria bacterium RIFCSPHIGHO2_12_FULL_41_15]
MKNHPLNNHHVENSVTSIQILAQQHAHHNDAIKAREHTHHHVIHYEYHRLNQQSRFYGTAFDFLSPWSHSRSRQAGTTLLSLLGLALGVFFAADGIAHLAHHIDKQYWSDGAPPSLSQQNKNYAAAQTITGSSSLGIALVFIFSALLVYYFIDRVRYMRGYRDFTVPLKTPSYKNIHSKSFFKELDDHTQFLMEQRFGLGLPAIADMLTSLQENLIDPNDEEEALHPVANKVMPISRAPLSSPSSRAFSIEHEQHLELPVSPTTRKPSVSIHKAELPTTPVAVEPDEPQQPARANPEFLNHLTSILQQQEENVSEIQRQREEAKQVTDRNQISIVVGNKRLVRRVEELERRMQHFHLGSSSALQAVDGENNLIDRLNRLEAAAFIPSQKLKSEIHPQLVRLQQEIDVLKENVLVDKQAFIPLLVFSIRKKMSSPGIQLGAKYRAQFLKKLLAEPYYETHPQPLSLILHVFFGFCRSDDEIFLSERNIDEKTFLTLSMNEQTQVLMSLNNHSTFGSDIAENLLETQALSKKAKTQLFRKLVKHGNHGDLTSRLLEHADRHLILNINDKADFLHSVSHQ